MNLDSPVPMGKSVMFRRDDAPMTGLTVDNRISAEVVDNLIRGSLKGLLLPFKGKGELRKTRNQAEQEWRAVCEEGERMVAEFKAAFVKGRTFLPLGLCVHRAARRDYLRWRLQAAAGHGQRYVDLSTDEGRQQLAAMSPSVRKIYCEWEPRVRQWNLVCRLAVGRLKALDLLLADVDAFEAVKRDLAEEQ